MADVPRLLIDFIFRCEAEQGDETKRNKKKHLKKQRDSLNIPELINHKTAACVKCKVDAGTAELLYEESQFDTDETPTDVKRQIADCG